MKSLRFPLIFVASLMIWNLSVGQSIIMKADTISFGLDSMAVVKLPEYRGVVKWQVSYDKTNWHNILQVNHDSIIVDKDVDAWYRAEVSDGTCNKVYSDTLIVQNSDTFKIIPYEPIPDIHGVVEGEQVTVIFNNDTIVCVKDSNEYIFQGDIVFTEDELGFLNDLKGASIPVWSFTERLWPEGKVYYTISNSWYEPLFPTYVNRAIAHWENNTPLEFIDIKNAPDQQNYIEFVRSWEKTNSRIGMVTGKQIINVRWDLGNHAIRHEIGHSIGLYHEHSRADRDKYIIVHKDNLIDPNDFDYAKISNSKYLGEFDYVSLMLYPQSGVSAIDKDKPILSRKDGGIWRDDLVQRELSPGDIELVNYLYSRPPFVKTAGVTDYNGSNVTCGGTVYNDGGSPVIERGISWNTTGDPKVGIQYITHDGIGTGPFTSMITNLQPNLTYYVRAYAKNSKGISYGNQIIFEYDPSVLLPTVYTNPIDVRMYFSNEAILEFVAAFAHGKVVDDGGAAIFERGACWNISGNATTADPAQSASLGGMGSYDVNIGLDYGVEYCLRAYANNKKGTSYGNEIVFTVNEFEADFPSIRTNEVVAVTGNSAKCGGIISTGTISFFSSRGVFYSTHKNPTVIDQVADIGPGGNGSFEVNLTGLESGKLYYARAFAVTERGTLYGSVVSFTTAAGGTQTGTFVDSRDGNEYDLVQVGDQVWMAENLAWLPSVSPPTAISYTAPYYHVYGYSDTDVATAKSQPNYATYGVLYNWPAALTACPTGWHLPSDAEWKQLEMTLGMTQAQADELGYRGTDQGTQMKTTSGWYDNGNGTNSSGFSALPGGCRHDGGSFGFVGTVGFWWSSTETSTTNVWYRTIGYHLTNVNRGPTNEEYGFSVRCVRD